MLSKLLEHLDTLESLWPEDSGPTLTCYHSANGVRKRVAWSDPLQGSAHHQVALSTWASEMEAFMHSVHSWFAPFSSSGGPLIDATPGREGLLSFHLREQEVKTPKHKHYRDALAQLRETFTHLDALLPSGGTKWHVRHRDQYETITLTAPNAPTALKTGLLLLKPLEPLLNAEQALATQWRVREIVEVPTTTLDVKTDKNEHLRMLRSTCRSACRVLANTWFDEPFLNQVLPSVTISPVQESIHPLSEPVAYPNMPIIDTENLPSEAEFAMMEPAFHLHGFAHELCQLPGFARNPLGLEFTLVFLDIDVEVVVGLRNKSFERQLWCGPLSQFIRDWEAICSTLSALSTPTHLYQYSYGTNLYTLSAANPQELNIVHKTFFGRDLGKTTVYRIPKLLELVPEAQAHTQPLVLDEEIYV